MASARQLEPLLARLIALRSEPQSPVESALVECLIEYFAIERDENVAVWNKHRESKERMRRKKA